MIKNINKLCLGMTIISVINLSSCGPVIPNKGILDAHTDEQTSYLSGEYQYISLYANGTEEKSRPDDIVYKDLFVDSILLSEDSKMTNPKSYQVVDNTVSFRHLKVNTTYYIQVDEEISSFTTGPAPRNLYVDGITNCRDMGGWSIGSNKYSKQGLIYRTSKLNQDESDEVLITEDGKNTLLEELGVKTEIDLRRVDNNENGNLEKSVLGDSVKYESCPMNSSGNILILPGNPNQIKKVFNILGNIDNYPVFYHCSIGTDRTGLIGVLINALLGVSEEDIYRDYLFSNFALIGSNRTPSAVKTYLDRIKSMGSGKELKEKTYNYLVSIGVNGSDIDSFRHIMTGE